MNYEFSSENPHMNDAVNKLLSDNIINLLNYIYSTESEPFNNPEIRIGLAIKILLGTKNCFDITVLQPIINDINYLIDDNEYLLNFVEPTERKRALEKELILINKYVELSETTYTLNHKTTRHN